MKVIMMIICQQNVNHVIVNVRLARVQPHPVFHVNLVRIEYWALIFVIALVKILSLNFVKFYFNNFIFRWILFTRR